MLAAMSELAGKEIAYTPDQGDVAGFDLILKHLNILAQVPERGAPSSILILMTNDRIGGTI
jgi:hypothetical protein